MNGCILIKSDNRWRESIYLMNDIIFSYRLYRIFAGLERKTARSVVFATEVP